MHVIQKVIEDVWNWKFDGFLFNFATNGSPLVTLGFHAMLEFGIFEKFHVCKETFVNFITKIERKYRNNPYHNAIHAAG